jgi:antitoxin HicB
MTETYQVVLTREPDGRYSVVVPDVDGCFTYGATIEEAVANAKEAIEGMLEATQQLGEQLPTPASIVVPVRVELPAPQIKVAS